MLRTPAQLLAVRPDRLACQFDILSPDTALLQVMKACVVFLARQARRAETMRRLAELRVALADVADVHPHHLAWDKIAIDRSNRRWRSLLAIACIVDGRLTARELESLSRPRA